ncbi:asparaginase [Tumebacillus permanentifrigoris]|uniref:asparaginase n=1 Tax=Tumebacillus permanentifrigoris TaxID=378543 RepID=A0A316DBE1_9BACL|nr:asparaginase [Tumebacillus permanentifrigoris]PWK14300.1 asparaginase [Tumebacillus permanentifrigoris]
MKHIIIMTTGGTIAMIEDPQTQTVRPVANAADLTHAVPKLAEYATVSVEAISNVPSPHLTPAMMGELGRAVLERLQRDDVDGIVITHGTDTLEETAYYLDLILPPGKPVIVTGAMRSSNELGADGPLNLLNSVRAAASKEAHGQGVLVVFNDDIHAARFVTKTHTSNVATFQSPTVGPIGFLDKRTVQIRHVPKPHAHIPVDDLVAEVGLLKMAVGMDDLLINCLLDHGTKGIVIEALGAGNVPPGVVPGIKRALAQDIPVVLVSRCYNGIVQDVYGYEGGGKQLLDLGVLFSNGLNGQKARIKLMTALRETPVIADLSKYFDQE